MRVNPVVAIAHVLAIALGAWGGWALISRVVPDFPSDDVEPGVSAAAEPGSVAGDDPDSLLRAAPLADALGDFDEQIAAGQGVRMLRIQPGTLHADTDDGEDAIDPGDISADVPEAIVEEAAKRRPRIDLAHVREIVLVAGGKDGGTWYLQLTGDDPQLPPPWTYSAPLDGDPVTAGGSVPDPVSP